MNNVVVFGTFDRLHEGHKAFLKEAKELGETLTVILAPESSVETLKQKKPSQSFDERKEALEALPEVNTVTSGDETLGEYNVLQQLRPDIIALGYDQDALKTDLARWMQETSVSIPIKTLTPHKPDIYKSSLLTDV